MPPDQLQGLGLVMRCSKGSLLIFLNCLSLNIYNIVIGTLDNILPYDKLPSMHHMPLLEREDSEQGLGQESGAQATPLSEPFSFCFFLV